MNFLAFYEHHVPVLEADQARHYMLLDALASIRQSPSPTFRGWTFADAGACAIQPMDDWAVMLGDLTEKQSRAVAGSAAATDFPSVMGPGQGPDWFAARVAELGVRMKPAMRNRIHVVTQPPRRPDVPGCARIVTAGDAGLFFAWMLAYMRAALPHDPVPDSSTFEHWSGQGNYLFWTVNGRPVSVAGVVTETKDGAAITGVYTPPELRGKGYATAITAAATQRIFGEGRAQAFLMAHVDNAPALRCYAKLGFRSVADFTVYWRDDG